MSENSMPHAVCIPYPAQGHITPMIKLAKLLHARGFYITFVNTEFNHRRLLKSLGPRSLDGLQYSFRFDTIPDGLPDSDVDVDATQDIPSLCKSTTNTCLGPFKDLLTRLRETGHPPVTCVISDGAMCFAMDAAKELGVPEVLLWTTSAAGFLGYVHYANFVDKGYTPLKDEESYLETAIDWIPGMEGTRLKDFPSFIRTTDPNEFMVHFAINEINRAKRVSAIVLNTFHELEAEVLRSLSNILPPPIYTVGPLHLRMNEIEAENEGLRALGSNLWKEETECLDWLQSKEPGSVVYVNFGSITVMSPHHLIEFAWGLANSRKTFLWIIRPDIVAGDTAILPAEFVEQTRGRGFMASWCPQERVLAHPAIGGFLTHSGWNSTIESISAGVPMICWPFFAEQPTNCWFCCEKWGIGREINSDAKRADVEELVRGLMDKEDGIGKKMKENAIEWKKKAKEAVGDGGSSYENFNNLISQVLIPSRDSKSNY